MIDYEKLKIIAYDFDDTLFAHSNHRTETIEEEIDYLKRCLLYKNDASDVFLNCTKNMYLQNFMNKAYRDNIIQGLISGTEAYVCSKAKIDYVNSIYGHYLENWCVCSQEKKTIMLEALAKSYNCNASNILIIDDNPLVITMAADVGFQSATPIEVVNYCELNNI